MSALGQKQTYAPQVRFTPDNDRESGFPQKVMSALPPKADMCGATSDVRYGPIADIRSVRLAFLNFTSPTQAPDYVGPASREETSRHYRRS
jgi:hypothetical protein